MQTSNHLGAEPTDIEDILKKIEISYHIHFEKEEFPHTLTFGKLCDAVIAKIALEDRKDCTSQQAFYKLRLAISKTMNIEKQKIEPETNLKDIFIRRNRMHQIIKVEKELGFALNILEPHLIIVIGFIFMFLCSVGLLFFNWVLALFVMLGTFLLILIANKTGKEFSIKTVREVAEKMAREHYLSSRRNNASINRKEIPVQIKTMFVNDLGVRLEEIKCDTIIV